MIIDGREMARVVLARAKARAEMLGRRPLVLVYVAPEETPATRSYLKIKARSAEAAGCDFEETRSLTPAPHADAFVVQLPLPSGMNAKEACDAIPVSQDADVLSSSARAQFESGSSTPGVNASSQTPGVFPPLLPPVVAAVREIFNTYEVDPKGKRAVVIGAGFLVGAPCATWLTQQGALVEVVTLESEKYRSLTSILQTTDIIISGAGSPHLIKPDMLKEAKTAEGGSPDDPSGGSFRGVVLIDAGTSESNGELAGDADPACADICSLFTPVPGGIGPLAVACLFDNAVTLAEQHQKA